MWIPLDEVVRAKVRTVNTAASILSTLAGVVLVAGAVALDVATYDERRMTSPDETFTGRRSSRFASRGYGQRARRIGPVGGPNTALLGMKDASDAAEETEFWTMEWTPLERPAGRGRQAPRPGRQPSGVPRGIDEAKLVVVDHPPGVSVAPDILGAVRAFSGPGRSRKRDRWRSREDIRELVSARDGALWRTAGGDPAAGAAAPVRDEITLSFPRPKGARKARLIVNAANSCWRAEFARQALRGPSGGPGEEAGKKDVYQEWEYGKVRVRMLTVYGWQTGQVLFAGGPVPAADMIYNLDLSDVGTDKVWLKLSPPSGYWLIDRLALDFGEDVPVEAIEVAAEEVDGPDAAEVLQALAVEDSTTLRLDIGDPPALLTFAVPRPKRGWSDPSSCGPSAATRCRLGLSIIPRNPL